MANGRGFHHPAPYWMARVCPVGGFPPVPTRGWFIPPPNSFFDVLFPPYILHRVDMNIAKKMFKQISSKNSLVYKNIYTIDSSTWSLYWLELLHCLQWSGFSLYWQKKSCKTLGYFSILCKENHWMKTIIFENKHQTDKIVMEQDCHGILASWKKTLGDHSFWTWQCFAYCTAASVLDQEPKKRKCLFLLLLTSCAKTKLKSNGNVPNISKCLDIMLPGVSMRQL